MRATNASRQVISGSRIRLAALAPMATLWLAGCATPPPASEPVAEISVQEDIGFTITEAARISDAVRVDYDAALGYLEQGELVQGIALLEQIVATAPSLATPHIDLGIAYHRTGQLEAAERSLERGLEANPGHPIAHNELGIIYRKTGRFVEARQSYEAALAIYPGYHYARRNLAVLCDLYLADPDCALANYEAYMATVPEDDEASIWIADLRQRMQQGGE